MRKCRSEEMVRGNPLPLHLETDGKYTAILPVNTGKYRSIVIVKLPEKFSYREKLW
jgi:hypothetical protein